jgi:Sortase and related acyltransferases
MIRLATPKDLPRLMELSKDYHFASRFKRFALWEDSTEGWQNLLLGSIEGPETDIIVYEKDDVVVGYIMAYILPMLWRPGIKVARVVGIWVDPGSRSLGIGSLLMRAFLIWAKEQGAEWAATGSGTKTGTRAANALARSHGFELEERMFIRRV